MIRAVTFDGHGVLYDRDRWVNDSIAEYLQQYVKNIDQESIRKIYITCRDDSFKGVYRDRQEMVDAFADKLGIKDLTLRRDLQKKVVEFSRNIKLFDGEIAVLKELKQSGYILGMITNTFQPAQEKINWFEQCGLPGIFDIVISSIEVGYRKPDSRIYQAFLDKTQLNAGEVVFIGHEQEELDGAAKVGIGTIAFNCSPQTRANEFLIHYKDLPGMLMNWM